jgi:(p)ppGpp synthase/HD superfamily hydrolase
VNDILLIARAWNFAAERHSDQRRKGHAQEPYINHLAEVAELVAIATEGRDPNLIAAAVLHDSIEDTATLSSELATLFNEDVARLVAAVSDDKALSKKTRKDLQIRGAPTKSRRAKMLKLADKTSNLRSLAKSPPADWNSQRQAEYLRWALKVAEGLRGTNVWLEARFDEAVRQVHRALNMSDIR